MMPKRILIINSREPSPLPRGVHRGSFVNPQIFEAKTKSAIIKKGIDLHHQPIKSRELLGLFQLMNTSLCETDLNVFAAASESEPKLATLFVFRGILDRRKWNRRWVWLNTWVLSIGSKKPTHPMKTWQFFLFWFCSSPLFVFFLTSSSLRYCVALLSVSSSFRTFVDSDY